MEKKSKGLLIIIALLIIIIVLLVGFIIFFINNVNFAGGKSQIRDLYSYSDNSTKATNENNDIVANDSISNVTSNNYISKEEALKKALEHAKINQNDIYDTNVEIDYKYNQTVYEIDFNYQQFEYEYYINAENGEIVKSFKERD